MLIQFNDDSKAVLIMQCLLWLLVLQINYRYLQYLYVFVLLACYYMC